jgi:3-hydroxyisobutyrate dehydrogenase-like beta-hydroxyacid dehydrogenase
MEIGFIGLGNMGFPIACRLLGGNHDVIAFDTRSEALERIVALGAQTASSAKEVADRAETVMASLPSPVASFEVATGAAGVIEGSRVKRYVDLSTVGSQTAKRIHDRLAMVIKPLEKAAGVTVGQAGRPSANESENGIIQFEER